jgi:hypothetical protein
VQILSIRIMSYKNEDVVGQILSLIRTQCFRSTGLFVEGWIYEMSEFDCWWKKEAELSTAPPR